MSGVVKYIRAILSGIFHRNQYFAILPIENTAAIGSVALWKWKLRDPRCPFLTVPDLCNNISVKFRFMADQQDTFLHI